MTTLRRISDSIDHDLLIEIKVKVEGLITDVKRHNDDAVARVAALDVAKANRSEVRETFDEIDRQLATRLKIIDDHETRIRFIEKYVWGVIALIGLINLVGVAYLVNLLQRH